MTAEIEICIHCGGQIFVYPDQDIDPSCFQCGRSNTPAPTLAEIRAREKPAKKPKGVMVGDNGQDVPRKQGRWPKEKVHPSHIPQIIKDGSYARFTAALKHRRRGTFLAHDIAVELGVTSGVAGACLRRARADGLVQDVGKRCMAAPHKGLVALWEAVPERAQRAS